MIWTVVKIVGISVALTVVFLAIVVWVTTFIENLEVEFKDPVDAIADHAERIAKIASAIIREREE